MAVEAVFEDNGITNSRALAYFIAFATEKCYLILNGEFFVFILRTPPQGLTTSQESEQVGFFKGRITSSTGATSRTYKKNSN